MQNMKKVTIHNDKRGNRIEKIVKSVHYLYI